MALQHRASAATTSFNDWIAEGVHIHLDQHFAVFAPSNALGVEISSRIDALQKLVDRHYTVLKNCTTPLLRLPRELWECILSCAVRQHQASAAVPTLFDVWVAEGTRTHLTQLTHAATSAPCYATAVEILGRIATLQQLIERHRFLLKYCASPLLRLPRELQEHIVVCVAAGQDVRKWAKLGHICSSLRQTLLDLHTLWGDAICRLPALRNEILKRAGPFVPLRLIINDSSDVRFALKHLSRAGSIYSSNKFLLNQILKNANYPALENLEEVEFNFDTFAGEVLELKPEHTIRETPRLKRVTLFDTSWNFHSSALTSLKVFFSSPANLPSFPQLLDVLCQNTQLRYLRLKNCIPDLQEYEALGVTVPLPHLHTLEMDDCRERVLQLWQLLAVDPATEVSIDLQVNKSTAALSIDDALIGAQELSLFKHHLRGREPQALDVYGAPVHRLVIGLSIRTSPQPDVHSGATSTADQASRATETLQLRYYVTLRDEYHKHWKNKNASVLRHICNELRLFGVAYLSWKNYPSPSRCYFDVPCSDVLSGFENVRHLRVNTLSPDLLEHLSINSPRLLDSLEELTVIDCRISGQFEDRRFGELSIKDLYGLLDCRARQNRPLRAVRLGNFQAASPLSMYWAMRGIKWLRARYTDCCIETSAS